MSQNSWFPHTSDKIINAVRIGGFASFIPSVIIPVWDDVDVPLAGFPISICFTGLRWSDEMDAASYVVSCYWFDPQSYNEDANCQSMVYRSRCQSDYQVLIQCSKRDRRWTGRKMRGSKVVVTAAGDELIRFVIQMTMRGLDRGEHVEPMLTRTDTASTGIWIYDPALAEVAFTGRLQ